MSSPQPPASVGGRIAAVFAGAMLVGAIHGLIGSWSGSIWEQMATGVFSNGLIAIPTAVAALIGARFVPAWRQIGTAFLLGACVGLPPLSSELSGSLFVWAFAGAAGVVLATALGPRLAISGRRAAGMLVVAVGLLAISVGMSLRPVEMEVKSLDFEPRTDAAPSAPDIVLISIDTLRADALVGGLRPDGYEIPFFDSLRAKGTWADYAWSSSNQTFPGHRGMFTGRDGMEHGVRYNYDAVPLGMPSFVETLHKAGYRTGGVVSNPLVAGSLGFDAGFDVYDDTRVQIRERVRDMAMALDAHTWLGWGMPTKSLIKYLDLTLLRAERTAQKAFEDKAPGRGRAKVTNEQGLYLHEQMVADDRPYFLFLHYMDAHAPYGPPDPWYGKLASHLPAPPLRYRPITKDLRYGFKDIERVWNDLRDGKPEAAAGVELLHHVYLEEVMYLDHMLAELMARIEATGRPTVVLLTADHGEHFGEHDEMTHATTLYEENLRVPFVLVGPGVPAGKHLQHPPHLMDVAPTLLMLAGLAEEADTYPGLAVHLVDEDRDHVAIDEKRFSVTTGGMKWIGKWGDGAIPDAFGLFRLRETERPYDERLGDGGAPPEDLGQAIGDALKRDVYRGGKRELSAAEQAKLVELGYLDDE